MLANLSTRVIAIAVAVIALILIVGFTVRSCDKRRSEAAQSRVTQGQIGAYQNSAADAVNTVGAASANEAASEDLTRTNEQQIRAAPGANDKVNPAVRDAGIAALCRRKAYANDPRCHQHP